MSVSNSTKASTNKSGKTQKTSYSMGNKYVTETRKLKGGYTKTTTKPVKRNSGRGR